MRICVLAACLCLLLTGRLVAGEEYRVLTPAGVSSAGAVLLVPGCSGFVGLERVNIYEERAAELQQAGYLVVFVDYLGRRGLKNCAHVSHRELAQDIVEAAAWTKDRPGVARDSVAAMAWSYGAGGVISALDRSSSEAPPFAKAVLFYPDCRGAKSWPAAGVSVLIFMGELDDVAPPSVCDRILKTGQAGGVRAIRYPGVRHAFDVHSLAERVEYPFGTLGYNAQAATQSWESALQFLK